MIVLLPRGDWPGRSSSVPAYMYVAGEEPADDSGVCPTVGAAAAIASATRTLLISLSLLMRLLRSFTYAGNRQPWRRLDRIFQRLTEDMDAIGDKIAAAIRAQLPVHRSSV
jgi:hypothetical protein